MFLLPILVLVVAGFAIYKLLNRQPHPATDGHHGTATVAVKRTPLWPTSTFGKLGLALLALTFLSSALVNVVQVPFLNWILVIGALLFTIVARVASHDRSTSVLIALILTAIGAAASLLFLVGEIFIGHD